MLSVESRCCYPINLVSPVREPINKKLKQRNAILKWPEKLVYNNTIFEMQRFSKELTDDENINKTNTDKIFFKMELKKEIPVARCSRNGCL